jgi:NitT/TauT family transport system permease protein
MSLFKLRGKLTDAQGLILGIAGLFLLIVVWYVLAELLAVKRPVVDYDTRPPSSLVPDSIGGQINLDSLARVDSVRFANATEFEKVYPLLPTPTQVVRSFPELVTADALFPNTGRSIWLNMQGYFWAVFLSIPIGFVIGLFPIFRGLFSKQVDALRYLPLTALTGLFIIWFGIEDQMKIAFLAFGIIVYLLPVVVQRIDEVNDVYLTTVFTLGATDWQTIRTVYIPSVMSKLIDDIRVLTAISWTYIIIAELLNRQGGVGSLIYIKARQGQIEKVFGTLLVIILVGFIQDRIFVYLDKRMFPHKHLKQETPGIKEIEYGVFTIFGILTALIFQGILLPSVTAVMTNITLIVILASLAIIVMGEMKLRRSVVEQ